MNTSIIDQQVHAHGPWPVMVLAHNEQFVIYVLANGCTDSTEAIVKEYSGRHPQVFLVSIAMPDKCNAWNVFIHEISPAIVTDSDVFFFMDGDARACPGTFSALAQGLRYNPEADAASALPATGRSMDKDRRELLEHRGLVANLYALRRRFITKLQKNKVRLPIGLEGDDGFLGALIKWDLDPKNQDFIDNKVVPCFDAGFVFDSVPWYKPNTWRIYWRRLIRYSRRRYEFELLGPRLKQFGIGGIPENIQDIYGDIERCRLKWDGLNTLFNWLALKEMQGKVNRNFSIKGITAKSVRPEPVNKTRQ